MENQAKVIKILSENVIATPHLTKSKIQEIHQMEIPSNADTFLSHSLIEALG